MTGPEFPAAGWADRLAVGLTRSWWAAAPLPILKPLGAAYGWGAGLRRKLHAAFGRMERADRPVISLGNLTVGGSGKTPLALALAGLFLEQGHRPAILSRGYGRRPLRPGPLVVSRGAGPLAGPAESGDEPWLMASELPALRVVVDRDRRRAARLAATELTADILILDDGFQYLPLAADCRILLAPSRRPFGNGAVLPAGPLREPLAAHRLAHILVSTGGPTPAPDFTALARGRPVFTAVHRPRGWRPLGGAELRPPETLAGRPALAFCGLGRPDSFQRTLRRLGLDIRRFLPLADHQAYAPPILAGLELAFKTSGAEFMVTTAKDAVKLPPDWPWPVLVLQTELRLDDPQAFFQTVIKVLNHDRQPAG
ncbi:MAG: tetraacyldisaccharide 4'-kinase [Candidatus Adiutrix sp.]|nr:tetraacyldisaccharide 4'-kinase [Candidatus Adiutrix sp.]